MIEAKTIPVLPIEIETLIWNIVKSNVHRNLKSHAWKDVHDELKRKVPLMDKFLVEMAEATKPADMHIEAQYERIHKMLYINKYRLPPKLVGDV